jgi:Family of unknown function (DUF6062)
MSQRFVGYFRLLEACEQAGCPICRCVAQDSRHHLEGILHELVTDLETRRRIRGAQGFCNWHTWMLLEIQGSRSGAAIIYADLLDRLVERVVREAEAPARRWWLTAHRRRVKRPQLREICPACEDALGAERRYLEAVLTGDDDAELQLAYANSDGLCAPHLLRSLELARRPPRSAWLVGRTIAKWARLRDTLARFVTKHDHRNREPFTAAEAAACERAFEIVSGAPGLFGKDLHPPATS